MRVKAAQYTIRNVPPSVDRALKQKAAARKMSLNALLLEAVRSEAGVGVEAPLQHDLDGFFGSWVPDKAVDRALREVRRVDPRDWK